LLTSSIRPRFRCRKRLFAATRKELLASIHAILQVIRSRNAWVELKCKTFSKTGGVIIANSMAAWSRRCKAATPTAPRRPCFPTSKQSELPCSGGDKVLFQHRHGDEKSRRR
jgi:hypothetical protein